MTRSTLWWTPVLLVSLMACSKTEENAESSSNGDSKNAAEQDKAAAIDPALAQAVAAAASAPDQGATSSAREDGPPPRGIFPPGGADAQIQVGQAPQVTVGSTGSEPRVRLTSGFGTKAAPLKSRIQVILQSGPAQGGLPVVFDVDFEEVAGAAKVEENPRRDIRAHVVAAALPQGVGRVPPELNESVAKLRGSEVRFELWPNGGATGFRSEVKQGTPGELSDMVRTLSDAIATATLSYPEEAVGKGGYWMVTSRDGVMGLDLVTYRMIRVEEVAEDSATLKVSTRRYASSTDFSLANLDGQFLLEEFQSGGEGTLRYVAGKAIPVRGRMQVNLGALLVPKEGQLAGAQPGARGRLELVSEARFSER